MTSLLNIKSPALRFSDFKKPYVGKPTSLFLKRIVKPVALQDDVNYVEIGIRSHGKGIFYKPDTTKQEIGNKKVYWIEQDLFIVNIVFAWEQAIAKTTEYEVGKIASHRFPMYKPDPELADLDYIRWLFLTKKGKHLLELASPGGAGRNKTLGQKEFEKLTVLLPHVEEQKKVSDFLNTIDKKTNLLKDNHTLLEQYKRGVMQKIFSQEIRFKDENSNDFPNWKNCMVKDITTNFSNRNKNLIEAPVYSVTNKKGFVLQSEQFERKIAGEDLTGYKIVENGDFAYNPARINVGSIAQFHGEKGVISSLYVCFKTDESVTSEFFNHWLTLDKTKSDIKRYGEGGVRVYLWYPLFSTIKIMIPCIDEQRKISDFLDILDNKLRFIQQQIEQTQTFKKGLLQQMFV